jgi:hypothetical protein
MTREEIIGELNKYICEYHVFHKLDGPGDRLLPLLEKIRAEKIADRVIIFGDSLTWDEWELYCDVLDYAHAFLKKEYDMFKLTSHIWWEARYQPSESDYQKIRDTVRPKDDGGWKVIPAPEGTDLNTCRTEVTAKVAKRKNGKATIEFSAIRVCGGCREWAEAVGKIPELGVPVIMELRKPFVRTVQVSDGDAAFKDEKGFPWYLCSALRAMPSLDSILKEKEVTVVC